MSSSQDESPPRGSDDDASTGDADVPEDRGSRKEADGETLEDGTEAGREAGDPAVEGASGAGHGGADDPPGSGETPKHPGAGADEAWEAPSAGVDREALEERVATLQEELAAARGEAEEHLERAQRVKADFDNYRKRKASEVERARREARDDLLDSLVDVLDSFDRALDQADSEAAREGIRLLRKQFLGLLESEGVERIEPEGETLDPRRHEAVLREPTDEAEEGTILQVIDPGYVRDDAVLRPARVKVASAPGGDAGEG